jgi:hypothetical protein
MVACEVATCRHGRALLLILASSVWDVLVAVLYKCVCQAHPCCAFVLFNPIQARLLKASLFERVHILSFCTGGPSCLGANLPAVDALRPLSC